MSSKNPKTYSNSQEYVIVDLSPRLRGTNECFLIVNVRVILYVPRVICYVPRVILYVTRQGKLGVWGVV